jgi:hypothetical protein
VSAEHPEGYDDGVSQVVRREQALQGLIRQQYLAGRISQGDLRFLSKLLESFYFEHDITTEAGRSNALHSREDLAAIVEVKRRGNAVLENVLLVLYPQLAPEVKRLGRGRTR